MLTGGIQGCLLKDVIFLGRVLRDEITLARKLRRGHHGPFHVQVLLMVSIRPLCLYLVVFPI